MAERARASSLAAVGRDGRQPAGLCGVVAAVHADQGVRVGPRAARRAARRVGQELDLLLLTGWLAPLHRARAGGPQQPHRRQQRQGAGHRGCLPQHLTVRSRRRRMLWRHLRAEAELGLEPAVERVEPLRQRSRPRVALGERAVQRRRLPVLGALGPRHAEALACHVEDDVVAEHERDAQHGLKHVVLQKGQAPEAVVIALLKVLRRIPVEPRVHVERHADGGEARGPLARIQHLPALGAFAARAVTLPRTAAVSSGTEGRDVLEDAFVEGAGEVRERRASVYDGHAEMLLAPGY
mmetsp:Transcript_88002/g.238635  ORF Transcript_88002/g.238635 Transcript_88002/m.238635 type:complete len:295 (+) Transcript_88002:255-1139(+)